MPLATAQRKHEKVQKLLLINRLLDGRELASSFVLVLDSLEQPADLFLDEIVRRSVKRSSPVIFLSFETLRPPGGVSDDDFVDCCGKSGDEILDVLRKRAPVQERSPSAPSPSPTKPSSCPATVIIDSLHPLGLSLGLSLPSFLATLLGLVASQADGNCASTSSPSHSSPPTPPSLFAVYHTSMPLLPPVNRLPFPSLGSHSSISPLALLQHSATSILTLHSPTQFLQKIAAQLKSRPEPLFGLAELSMGLRGGGGDESGSNNPLDGGIVVGLGSACPDGLIVEAEIRRRGSGKGQNGWYYLGRYPSESSPSAFSHKNFEAAPEMGKLTGSSTDTPVSSHSPYPLAPSLLADYPPYAKLLSAELPFSAVPLPSSDLQPDGATFSLSLTDRQRKSRDAVVLPYFDAQKTAQAASANNDSGGRDIQRPHEEAESNLGVPQRNMFDLSAMGQGGRILYDMGEEDDFDEEEDEI